MSSVQLFSNGNYELKVRENGLNIEFDAENVAKSLGFTRVQNGKPYIRWERVNGYLSEFGFTHQVGKGDFIPESYVYMLGMKGENDLAVAFQKFVAFEVLPQIRKNKVYIDSSATDQEIDNAVRFATPQKRRRCLLDAHIDGKNNVFVVYDDIKEYMKKWTADEKVTTLMHVERVLQEKQEMYGNDVAFVHKIEQLKVEVAKDIDKLKNWSNGAQKRELSKENKELKQLVKQLNPSIEDYHVINYHPFSNNSMFINVTDNKKVRTYSYNKWLDNFPVNELPVLDVDFTKPIELFLYFDHLPSYDQINFTKSIADKLATHYVFNDVLIHGEKSYTNKHVKSYKDGKIYFHLRNKVDSAVAV